MWSQELILIGKALLLFLGLSFLYWIIFKRVQWHSTLMKAVTARVRLVAYLLVPLVPFVWGLHLLVRVSQGHFLRPESALLLRFSSYLLLVVCVVFAVETGTAFVFDYFFAAQRKTDVPLILRSLTRGVVYVTLFLFLLPQIFGLRDLAGLLTSSAILSIILGLALQETLGNLFAGIGMQMSRPYKVGDWIRIGTHEGIVERADWRAVAIRTLTGDQISFPHSFLAKLEIQNYSSPSSLHAREVQVGVHYQHPPYKVEAVLLRCALETQGVRAEPAPRVRLTAYQDFAVLYSIKFWIDDFARHHDIASDLLKRVWYHLKRQNLQIPFPIQDVYYHKGDVRRDIAAETLLRLKGIEFLRVLTDEQLRELAERLATQIFARNETICRQGEQEQTFYIVKTGKVLVSAQNDDGQAVFLRHMGPGEFFGEISLLTGEPRSATVTAIEDTELLVMDKEDMRCMLEANSQLAEHISQVLAVRQQQLEEQRVRSVQQPTQAVVGQDNRVESLRREFLTRIVNFFSY